MCNYGSGTPDPVVASRDGVTVEKSFGSDDFPIPTITFVIESERDETVDVRFVDPVPDDVALEGVGFHPRFGSEHWSIEDDDIVFERSLEPGEELTTVYGLRGKDVVDPERLMSEPIIERVDPSYADSAEARLVGGEVETALEDASDSTEEDASDSTDEQPTAEPPADPAESQPGETSEPPGEEDIEADPGLDPGADPDVESEVESNIGPDVESEVEPEEARPETSEMSEEIELLDSVADAVDGNGSPSVAAALAREIRNDEVDEEDLKTLRSALGETAAPEGSVDARLKHLQTRVADFDAYIDALEAFLDEEGDARTLLSDLRTDIRELDGRILSVEDRIEELSETTDDRIEELSETTDDRIEEIAAEFDTEFDTLWEDVDAAQTAIADLEADQEQLRETIEELEDDLSDVESVQRELEAIAEDVSRLDDQLAELSEMRERLSDVFGGAAGGSDDE